MSSPVTEICAIPLKAGIDLTTGDNQKLWEEGRNTIAAQPGCKSLFWGRRVEEPDTLQLVIDWDDYQSHKNFMENPIYEPFIAKLLPLIAAPHFLYHASLGSTTATLEPLSAPVTECVTIYFDPDHPNSTYEAEFAKFVELAKETADKAMGVVGGWVVEELQHEKLGKAEGEKGPAKVFSVFIGWPNVEAHMKYREHEVFPNVAKHLRGEMKAIEMYHVEFQKH